MSTARLKSLIIAVLFFINLFFVTNIVWSRLSFADEQSRTIESLGAVMLSSGLSFADDASYNTTALEAYTTSQDAFAEAVIARTILGDCEPVQSDSGQKYAGDRGTATFNPSGVFIIDLTDSYSPSDAAPERAVRRLLKSMDVDTTEPVATTLGNTTTVVTYCTWRGSRIFNCTVSFTFVGTELVNVTGCRPSGVAETQNGSYISFSTATLSFIRFNQAQETPAAIISSFEPGYRMNVGAFGEGTLTPGWLIKTDTGDFFADATSGEVLRNDA